MIRDALLALTIGLILVSCGPNDGVALDPGDAPALRKRVFVTSGRIAGNMRGVTAGDAFCNAAASQVGLGGAWIAWLSDSGASALARLPDVGPWYLVDRATLVFRNRTEMSSVTTGIPLNIIDMTEYGTRLSAAGSVWTGTNNGGTQSGANCDNWSSTVNTGSTGVTTATNAAWSNGGATGCTNTLRLYCFET